MNSRSKFILTVLALALVAACLTFSGRDAAAEEEPADSLAQYYGFGRMELYKLQQRSQNLLAADLNNDGKTDLVLIDNSNSRLDLLQQRTKGDATVKPVGPARINAVENDKRFEHKKIAVDREVAALAVGDFNGDGRKDLACFGAPDQLAILLQSPAGDWTNRKRIRLPDV